ncbi:MAG: N-6 DNA methylase [Clostridiales bacterium]|nr:N-6 DNA methylase [Clostridiales bacterium]
MTKLIKVLGFLPKEYTSGVYQKKYSIADGYAIEIDCSKREIHYGDEIKDDNKATQNFMQAENWVVLECVNRLLEKGYQPKNITLEKTWRTGHGTSGRLDILVSRDDGTAYLMIECKTWGTEYKKELKNIERNGGQLFTYFQQDKNADVLMLYTSKLDGKIVEFQNTIIKIEEHYRQAGNVKDFFERWNKLPKSNGVFDDWVEPYEFQSKALTRNDLKVLKQEDSSFIFNRFLEILRYNVVSDKPNAFNKIFNLFLCKIIDEDRSKNEQLHFQWLEGEDDHISFQKRLTDLYYRGMLELLGKRVTDITDAEFDRQFQQVRDDDKKRFKEILTDMRLKKNNEFAIKEVYDDESFIDNAKVLKEVVELLQVYQIRYNNRQQFLGDFFELLLTTGLKQESGQFFTPVPIARYIIKSLPIKEITLGKMKKGISNDLLPKIIDYAAGSGHFITEAMEVVQEYINDLDEDDFPTPSTQRTLRKWQEDQFDWVKDYMYAIEKDYRLVKTAKVSCYLHGDGLAKVIHGDGLGDFATSEDFKGLLKVTDSTYAQDNKQFDAVISNPPYSVSAFKGMMMEEEKALQAFDLYSRLTDQSSEIECLFVERAKQLLKDDGVAGIILPSSILNNAGIYTQTREIILKHFDIIGVTELGSSTFMATGINTVVLFLRRRNNADAINIREGVKRFFVNFPNDNTINRIEKPAHKYVAHVWENLSYDDYVTLLSKKPNKAVIEHEMYREYQGKIRAKDDAEKWGAILELEQEKLFYFILAYPQTVAVVKTGPNKEEEKRFLGYEFSFRRGSEGIHPIKRGKSIDECTLLFDADGLDNPNKASYYNYKAFQGEFYLDIPEHLRQNVSYQKLVDMISFDRVTFEKTISLAAKTRFESKWDHVKLSSILDTLESGNRPKGGVGEYLDGVPSLGGEHIGLNGKIYVTKENIKYVPLVFYDSSKQGVLKESDIMICKDGALTGKVALFRMSDLGYDRSMVNEHVFILRANEKANQRYLFNLLLSKSGQELLKSSITGQAQGGLNRANLLDIRVPVPPLSVQQSIVSEIDILEKNEEEARERIDVLIYKMTELFEETLSKSTSTFRLSDDSKFEISIGKRVLKEELVPDGKIPVISANVFVPFGVIDELLIEDFSKPSVLWGIDGDWMVNYIPKDYPFYPTDHCGVLRVKGNLINERYLAFALEKEGRGVGFSRTNRASIERIQGIRISAPPLPEQERFVSQIQEIETKIQILQREIVESPTKKEAVLKKWLN